MTQFAKLFQDLIDSQIKDRSEIIAENVKLYNITLVEAKILDETYTQAIRDMVRVLGEAYDGLSLKLQTNSMPLLINGASGAIHMIGTAMMAGMVGGAHAHLGDADCRCDGCAAMNGIINAIAQTSTTHGQPMGRVQ